MTKLPFAIVALVISILGSLAAPSMRGKGSLDITLQINWDDGSAVQGTLNVYNEDGSLCCSWTVDDTGWADIHFSHVSAGDKLGVKFTQNDGTVLCAQTIPVKSDDSDMFLALLNGKQLTVTLDPSDNSIEDVHLEDQ